MEECISIIQAWIANNFLKLNDDKTEVLILGSPHMLNQLHKPLLHTGMEEMAPIDSAWHISTVFDSALHMDIQVSTICKGA